MISLFKKKALKTHKSYKTLWLYNYNEILQTQDLRWLVKDFDEDSELTLTEKQTEELTEIWEHLFSEYLEVKGDQVVINHLRKRVYISNIQNRLYFGTVFVKLISQNPTSPNLEEMVDELAKYKFKIDKEKPLGLELEKITKQLKGLKTRLNLEVSKYNQMIESRQNKEKVNLQDQIISVGKVLDLKYPINAKETTLAQWDAYCNNAKKLVANGREN